MNSKTNEEQLDTEWVNLILEAKTIGLTVEDIRCYLAGFKENPFAE